MVLDLIAFIVKLEHGVLLAHLYDCRYLHVMLDIMVIF